MLIAAAFCPHPPLLVPEVAACASGELDSLREACASAVRSLYEAAPELLCVLGAGEQTASFAAGSVGSLADFGVDRRVTLGGSASGAPVLPLSLTVGAYLLAGAVPVVGQAVAATASPAECAQLGRSLHPDRRLALLVMGDGSARRTPDAPGAFDPRGVPFDDGVVRALREVDTEALLALTPELAEGVLAAGRPAWQVAAGAVTEPLAGEVLYAEAPYDVGYVVARWV